MMNDTVFTTMDTPRRSRQATQDDIPRDAHLPQLSLILNADAMRDPIWNAMFESAKDRQRFLIRHCDIIQVRYKPGSSCMISYCLDIKNVETGEHGEQILCGRAFPKDRSQSQWEKAATRALVQPRFGKPLLHLPEIEMVLWAFPNDRKMHTLPAAMAAIHSTSAMPPSWLLSHVGPGWHLTNTTSQLIHYVGEHTCTLQTSLTLAHPSQTIQQALTLFGKTYYNEEGAQTDHVMRQLWESEARRRGQLSIAQPLRYDTRLRTLWQLGITGTTVEDHAIETAACLPLLTKAAHAVAMFHSTPVSNIPSITVVELLSKLNAVTATLMQCRPSCRPLLLPLRDLLTAQANRISVGPTATLHGDLHLKNLFLAHDTIALIDLDNVRQGHPGQDIGSFLAGLLAGALAKQVLFPQLAGPLRTFLDHYQQHSPWKLDDPTLAWFTAMALVTERASRCVTRLKVNHRGMMELLLILAYHVSKTGTVSSACDELAAPIERNWAP